MPAAMGDLSGRHVDIASHSHQIERAKGECKSWTRVQNTDAVRNIANNRVEKYVNRDPVMLLIRSYQTQFLQFDMTRYTGSTRG